MRGSWTLLILLFLTSVGCGRNAPLPTVTIGAGTAGAMPPTAESAGQGGSTPAPSSIGATTITGIADASGASDPAGASAAAGSATCGAQTQPNGRCVPGAFPGRSGVCQCQRDYPCACPNVGCVDLKLDPDNCGACGAHCGPTSACNAGACGPAPVMVSGAIAGCHALTMVATDAVYFTDAAHGTVNEVGAATPLATNEMGATMIQQVGTNLYWYAPGSKSIRRMATTGGAVADVFTATVSDGGTPHDVAGFLVTSDSLSVYVSLGTQVLRASTTNIGTPTVVVNELHGGLPAALALNGSTNIVFLATLDGHVYAPLLGAMPATCPGADNVGNLDPMTCPRLSGCTPEMLPSFVTVIAGHAYWIDGPNVKGELIGPTGTSFDSITSSQTSKITAAVATTDTIYFADEDPPDPAMPNMAGGFIEKAALTPNSTATLLARGQLQPQAIAVDATKVYWANADCSIMSQNR
jgi:hypothetical protein